MMSSNSYGVSEVVGTILVLGIAVSSITVTLTWAGPYIDGKKADTTFKSALTQFTVMNEVLQDLVSQGVHSNQVATFSTDRGNINVNSQGDRCIIWYSIDDEYTFDVSDLDDEDAFKICQVSGWTSPRCYIDYLNGTSETVNGQNKQPCSGGGDEFTVYSSCRLEGAVQINVANFHGGGGGPGGPLHLVGRIWLFDWGSITYEMPSSSGTREIVHENGAVIHFSSPSDCWVNEEPIVFHQNNHFILSIIQITGSTGTGGAGTYKFSFKVDNRSIMEDDQLVYNFKIQLFGEHAAAWRLYFTNKHGFTELAGTPEILWLSDTDTTPIRFTLTHSVCNVIVGGLS